METPIRFTREAFALATDKQHDAIIRLAANVEVLEVMQDFSLPTDYLAFRQKYNSETKSIYGGISPEGDVSLSKIQRRL